MRIPTKLWLLMLTSALISFIIFISLIIVTGRIGNQGYNLNKLNMISESVIDSINNSTSFTASNIGPILDLAHQNYPEIRFEWIASDGSTIYDTAGEYTQYEFEQLANRMIGMPQNLWGGDDPISLTYSISKDNHTYYLLIGLSSYAMKNGQIYFFVRSFEAFSTILIPLIIAFLIPYFFCLWFFFSMNNRLNKLNRAMGELNLNSTLTKLEDKRNDEIGKLIGHFNEMALRIQNQTEQIKQFDVRRRLLLSNLSHDLRTPLTMILGYAETIRTGKYKDEMELQASAKVLLQRSRYMNKLLDQLLEISKQDEDDYELFVEPHNVSELLRKIAADYVMFLEGQHFHIEVTIPDDDIMASIDAALIERAVRNLIDNAIRYGADGHYLEIKLWQANHFLFIAIRDKGTGIAQHEQPFVFDRFYRVNSSRKGEGLGIGLSIVKEIITFHGGNITLTSEPFHTVFEIKLPINL